MISERLLSSSHEVTQFLIELVFGQRRQLYKDP